MNSTTYFNAITAFTDNGMTAHLSGLGVGMTVFSLLGTFVIGFSMLPQTIMTLKIKQTATLSLAFYAISGFACFVLMLYGFALSVVPWQGWNYNALNVLDQVGSVKGSITLQGTIDATALGLTANQVTLHLQDLGFTNVVHDTTNANQWTVTTDKLTLAMWAIQSNGAPITGADSSSVTDAAKTTVWAFLTNKTDGIIKKAGYNVAMGFNLPGAAVVFGEFMVSLTSFLIAWQKFSNMRNARAEKLTEKEYEEKHYGHIIAAHNAKVAAKRHTSASN